MPRKLIPKPNMGLPVAASITLSAGTYLFDFVSNMVVVYEYGRTYTRFVRLEHEGNCSSSCRVQTSELTGYFMGMVGVLIFSHTLNAVIFKFKFKKEDAPLRAAYFLPLIHFWRLVDLLWRTLSFKGVQDLRSGEMNGLYNILGSSFEGAPFLILQFCAYLVLVRVGLSIHNMLFKVSVAASVLCAAYNGGTAVLSVAENAKTLREKVTVALAAGLFTMFATINRCLTYTNIIVRFREHFLPTISVRSRAKFHVYDTIPAIFLTSSIASYWLFYWLLQFPKAFSQRLRDPKRCLTSFTFAYMSILLGPLYPMVSEAKDAGQLGRPIFHARLVIVVLLNLSADMVILSVTFALGTLPVPYLIVSLVAAVGYLVSIGWYIRIDIQTFRLSRFGELDREDLEKSVMDLDVCEGTPPLVAEVQLKGEILSENCNSDVERFRKETESDSPRAILSQSDSDVEIKSKEDRDHMHREDLEKSGMDLDVCEGTPPLVAEVQLKGKILSENCNSDVERFRKETESDSPRAILSQSDSDVEIKSKEDRDHMHSNEKLHGMSL